MRGEPSFWRRNGLSLVLAAIFVVFLLGQVLTGQAAWNEEIAREGRAPLTLWAYLDSGHFISATFENWESEFLQMGMYVLLTVWLRQMGSAESRPFEPRPFEPRPFEPRPEDIEPGPAPWPVRRGGLWRRLYAHSLTAAFLLLFLGSFALHGYGSWRHHNDERRLQGRAPVELSEHLRSSDFWFESFQNWQSEFLAVLSIVVLSIFLREDKSPESKPVRAPHRQTGA
ncbi:DUF6766 family protein [Lysobacter enzymogenes]|uniref:DUF6766 family protein n=1 Tax=Lysobacter enzymogenes TaxID=69 RepID=UPI001AF56ABA|nr:DUF6766 family protein [Lysobacter enzymogenes]QQP99064.1 hypothetical protein JHW41_13025 [Lysobacter enzymogenes]